jgi:hypothetical protein
MKKSSTASASSFVMLSKSATKSLEMLREVFGEHSLSWTAVLNDIHA